MKFEQKKTFEPITITHESYEEAQAVWHLIAVADVDAIKEEYIFNLRSNFLGLFHNLLGDDKS